MLSGDIKSKVLLACIGVVVVSCFVWIEGSEESQPPTLTKADWSRINLSSDIALRSTSLKVPLRHRALMLEYGMKPEEIEALLSIDEVQIEKSDRAYLITLGLTQEEIDTLLKHEAVLLEAELEVEEARTALNALIDRLASDATVVNESGTPD